MRTKGGDEAFPTNSQKTMLDLVAIGGMMVEFTCVGKTDAGMLLYERNPLGASVNVASQVAKLGGRAGIIATIGKDEHGDYLYGLIESMGLDVRNVKFSEDAGTMIRFSYLKDDGERYLTNYKGPRSDLEIYTDKIDISQAGDTKVFLYTHLSHIEDTPIHQTTADLLGTAADGNAMIAYAPNRRTPFNTQEERQAAADSVESSQILKLTVEELEFIFGEKDIYRGTGKLLRNNAKIVAVTMGKDGCFLRNRNGCAYQPAYAVDVLDTTGAGDSFMGAMIYMLTRDGIDLDAMTKRDLDETACFANACASASTMLRGSFTAMPSIASVQWIIKNTPRALSAMTV
jgi:sugar/nucleoside kinase (ribokinase family)